MASALSFVCLHVAVDIVSARETLLAQPTGVLLWSYMLFLCIANLCGLLVLLTFGKDFTFAVPTSQSHRPADVTQVKATEKTSN